MQATAPTKNVMLALTVAQRARSAFHSSRRSGDVDVLPGYKTKALAERITFAGKVRRFASATKISLASIAAIRECPRVVMQHAEQLTMDLYRELIAKAPKIGLFKIERPEIVAWDFAQYARLLRAAKVEGEAWYAAVCLAGEAGLRVGEVKALRWRGDVDLIARTITVNQQTCKGDTGTPKGRTRRTVPMTATLHEALKRMSVIREGLVVRSLDGTAKTDSEARRAIERICRRSGLPVRQWHTLRHTFGTHAALFGVNPWRLQAWLGHKRIDETMFYVHVAEDHRRDIPEVVLAAGTGEHDPDRRIMKLLGARASHVQAALVPAIESGTIAAR